MVEISFPSCSASEASVLAASLNSRLRELHRDVEVSQKRENPEAQDAGTILSVILGSAAIASVAKGVAAWLAKHAGTSIEVHRPDGTSVLVKYASGEDTAETVRAALT
jgi:hypothetical protein